MHLLEDFIFCPRCGGAHFVVNDEKSKRCENCGFVYYFNPSTATVGVIVNKQGEWLVVRRAKEPAKGTLDLPGGFADCFETAEEGMLREVEEETGLKVGIKKYLFSIPNQYVYSDFTVHTIDIFFRCEIESCSTAKANDDAAEILWLHPSDINPEDFGLKSVREGVKKLLVDL